MLTFSQFLSEDAFPHFKNAEHVVKHVETKFPGVKVSFHDTPGYDHAHLSNLQVPSGQQKKGIGTHVMNAISHYADHKNKTVTLTPESSGRGQPSKTKLTDWYKRFDFKPHKGRNRDYRFNGTMIRRPTPPKS